MIIPSKKLSEIENKITKIEKLIALANLTKNKKLVLLALEQTDNTIKKLIEILPEDKELPKKEEIIEIFEITNHHKKSDMEFLRGGEVIILSKKQEIKKISPKKLTKFLNLVKSYIENISQFKA